MFKKFFIFLAIFILGSAFFITASNAGDYGLGTTAGKIGYDTTGEKAGISSQVGLAVGVALAGIGLLFLGLMIYGGVRWMTAMGEEEKVTKARGAMIAATIGIVLVVSAYAISRFVLEKVGIN